MEKYVKANPKVQESFGEHWQFESYVVWPFEKLELDTVFDEAGRLKSYKFGIVH